MLRVNALMAARLGLIALGLALPITILELALRMAGPVLPGDYQTAAFTTPSAMVGRLNKPNTAGWKRTNEFTTWVSINSHGLRGPEIDYVKQENTFRVLLLGDSFVFALQVSEEETFGRRLAEQLQMSSPVARVEVVNASVDGWSTANQYAWLTTEGYRYKPDLVLLMFYVGNDPGGNADQVPSLDKLEQLRLPGEPVPLVEASRQVLRSSLVSYNVLEQGVLAKLSPAATDEEVGADRLIPEPERREIAREIWGAVPNHRIWGFDSERKVRGWTISEALMVRLRDFCASSRAGLAIVGVPTNGQMRDAEPTSTPLPLLAARIGVPLIELLEPFRAQPRKLRERLYFQENQHWTPVGHKLAAEFVARELLGLNLVRPR